MSDWRAVSQGLSSQAPVNPEVHRSQSWRRECLLGNGNRREQGQKIKKFDVQSWAVQLKSQRVLRQGEGGEAGSVALIFIAF